MVSTYAFAFFVAAAFVAAALVARASRAFLKRLIANLEISAEQRAHIHERALHLSRALTLLVYGIAAVASVSLVLGRYGLAEVSWDPRSAAQWTTVHGVNIVIILIGSYIIVRASHLAIDQTQYRLGLRHAQSDLEWQRRAATLAGIMTHTVTAVVAFIAILMLLRELSIDVLPILTGAGIAGLAIGFGAQNLVRDVISGFFLILEDQVRVGDLVRINGVGGTVEQIKLRTIVLRDGDGAVQVFPNGTVTSLANLSKQFAYATVDVKVAYNENLDRVIGTIRDVGAAIQADAALADYILAPIEVLGVESIADGAATIRTRFKTQPLKQGKIANELRRRLMSTFVGRGIRPYAG